MSKTMNTAAPIKKIPLTSSDVVIAQMQQAIFDVPRENNDLSNYHWNGTLYNIFKRDPYIYAANYTTRLIVNDITDYFLYLSRMGLLIYKADTTLTQTIVKPYVVMNNIYNNIKTTIDCKSLTTLFIYIFRKLCNQFDIKNNGYSIDLFYYKTKNHVGMVPLHVACTVYSNDPNNEQGYLCDMAKLLLLLQNGHMTLAQPVKVVKYCNHTFLMANIPFGSMAKVTVKNPL